MSSSLYSMTKATFVSVLHSGIYGRVLEDNHEAAYSTRTMAVVFVLCQVPYILWQKQRLSAYYTPVFTGAWYYTPQRIMLGVDKTFKRAWELHIPGRPENILVEGSREIRGYYIYLADRRIYSSKEVGKFLSFFSIFLLTYLYSDWQVCVLRCVVGFRLLHSDGQLCVLRCVVGFNLSQWVSLCCLSMLICVWPLWFMCVIVCMDGIEFCLYDMILNFIMALNLIENVTALIKCSFIGNLFM